MNYAIWESVEHFRNAFSHPEFQKAMDAYPSSAVASPHLLFSNRGSQSLYGFITFMLSISSSTN